MNCLPLPVLESTRQDIGKARQKVSKLLLSGLLLNTVDAGTAR